MNDPRRNTAAKSASLIMLGVGAASLTLSVIYSQMLLVLIGLGLTFWGALLLYIHPGEYIETAILNASTLSPLTTVNQILRELDYEGNAIYLPPKYFKNPENSKIYISKQKDAPLPDPEQVQKSENQVFVKNPEGILLTPPGAELARLFEKSLKTSFTKVDLEYLQKNLPKLLIENLEIADSVKIEMSHTVATRQSTELIPPFQTRTNSIHVKITSTIYNQMCRETSELPGIISQVGCPVCSAIACAIAKASGRSVRIERTEFTEDGRTIEPYYSIIEE
jgi:hypothetical protein